MPINLISKEINLDDSQYSLIVIENSNFYKRMVNAIKAKILIIRSSIEISEFAGHKVFGIDRGAAN
jgi:hypothetical protein